MRVLSKKRATYADIVALPENVVGELIDGELIVSPRPSSPHAIATGEAFGQLWNPFQRGRGGPGGWWFLIEPELHFGADVLVPDLAAWRRERMPSVPRVPYFTLAPDWVCEVLSPSNAKLDLVRKLPRYARASVKHAWIIDPANQTLQAFQRAKGSWNLQATFSGDDRVSVPPFDSAVFELGYLWLEETPTPTRRAKRKRKAAP